MTTQGSTDRIPVHEAPRKTSPSPGGTKRTVIPQPTVREARTLLGREARERRPSRQEVAVHLAGFAERERTHKAGRDAGLPPREYELFTFFVDNPDATNPQAAQALGVAVGTIKSMRYRIKNTPGIA